MTRPLLLVDELMGKDQYRKRQRHRLTRPWPGIRTAEEKVRCEKTADKENERRQNEPYCVGKNGKSPARTDFYGD
jgi:hypothetical protein